MRHPEEVALGCSFATGEAGDSHTLLLVGAGKVWNMGAASAGGDSLADPDRDARDGWSAAVASATNASGGSGMSRRFSVKLCKQTPRSP